MPKALADAGEYGENLYDYAKVDDWKHAEVRLAALGTAVGRVRSEAGVSRVAPKEYSRLASRVLEEVDHLESVSRR